MSPTAEHFGRFTLLRRLASGGMGEIFLARYTTAAGIERLAVVKRMLPHLSKDRDFVNHFLNEGRLTSLLAHPNVVRTLELGRVSDQYYMALEHVPGHTLVRLLANGMRHRQQLSIGLIHHIALQVAAALAYVHSLTSLEGCPLGIIHMDIAPHNIMISPEGHAVLLDFGISRATGLHRSPTDSTLRGRTSYLAPEQIDGRDPDQRLDIFAFGVILHEMIAGRPLFRTRNEQQTATRILYSPIPSLSAVRSDCPEQLEQIVQRALARNRNRRFQSAEELLAALDSCGRQQQISPSLGEHRRELASLVPDEPEGTSVAPSLAGD